MAEVTLRAIDKHYGDDQVVHDVSLTAGDGEFVVFVGPSGCGKSTLLRCIAGLESISGGTIAIGDRDVTDVAPADRGVAMVFQSYALYPHMSVRANMEFGLKVNGVEPGERERRIGEAARVLQLEEYLDRRPGQLSGGQRQRVAIGRAIVKQPQVFLLDEPLSNLDAALRVQMRVELETLHSRLGSTMIYVTHDQVEAMTLADRIVVLNEGRVEQIGAPLDLYHRPRTRFVAGFIGSPRMNFLPVTLEGSVARCEAGAVDCTHLDVGRAAPGELTVGIRPEHLDVGPVDGAELAASVHVVEALGSETYVHVSTADGHRLTVKSPEDVDLGADEPVGLHVAPGRAHLFDAAGSALPVAAS